MDWQAWAAGLFEGEGWITIRNRNGRRYPIIALQSTDEDVVRRFHEAVGVGNVVWTKPARKGWKQSWKWQAFGWEPLSVVAELIGPYLGERRSARLREALACEPNKYSWRETGPHCHLPPVASVAGRTQHLRAGTPICDRCRVSHNLYYNAKRGTRNTEVGISPL